MFSPDNQALNAAVIYPGYAGPLRMACRGFLHFLQRQDRMGIGASGTHLRSNPDCLHQFLFRGAVTKPGRTIIVADGQAYAFDADGEARMIATMTGTMMTVTGRQGIDG